MSRTEASVRDTSPAGGSVAVRAQEAPGADDGRFGFGRFFLRDINQRTSVAKTLEGAIGPGYFVPGQDGFNGDEYKNSSEQWRHDLEMKPL